MALSEADSEAVKSVQRRMTTRMVVGAIAGAVIGYAIAIIAGANAWDLTFWIGFAGFWVGAFTPLRLADGGLVLDQEISPLYRKDTWLAVKRVLPLFLPRLAIELKQNTAIGIMLGVMGAGVLLGGILNWLDSDPRGSGVPLMIGIATLSVDVWIYREKVSERITRARAAIGTALIILGVGVIAALLSEVPNGYSAPVPIGIAAMMVVGGWFLRQAAGRE